MKTDMNTFCKRCKAYTESRLINIPAEGVIECRCAKCNKFKDFYEYAKPEHGPDTREFNERLHGAAVALFWVGLAIFGVALFALNLDSPRPILIGTFIGSLLIVAACVFWLECVEPRRDEEQ